ncbi:MAG TPA: glycoside hydrolase family 15 protein [Candidatus Angelobacter sp.]
MLSYHSGPPKIHDYGMVGDCRSVALISKYGSIDWLCWPRFDSPSIFARLLDEQKGGYWSIAPAQACQINRCYVGDSNILQTDFFCSSGRATLTDFMPVTGEAFKRKNMVPTHELLRQLVCTEGEIEIKADFQPRPYYGAERARIRDMGPLGLRMDVGRGTYWLRSNILLTIEEHSAHASITVKRGDTLQFSLSYAGESPAVLPALGARVNDAILHSSAWWEKWAARSSYQGPYRDAVVRSALVLKLLAYAPSGAIIAAPTTSLPERIGGRLNWDYRYCWLRDASLTVRALLGLGYIEETDGFLTWLLHATRMTQPELKILYNVFGQLAPHERELMHLRGYKGSAPVRIGNAARKQLQLDVYGEVIDASAQYGHASGSFDRSTQKVLIGFGKYVAKNWNQPDEGIWEPRSGKRNNTHSRLLCWTALDRLLAMDEKGILHGVPREWFTQERERIREQIQQRAWNDELNSYVDVLDSDGIDATLLRIPWYGFEEARSERMKSTYIKVCERLDAGNGLLFRYQCDPREGAFGICGFWGVEYLALGGGTLNEAHQCFDSLLKFGNDLGLFAEEIDPASGEALGNFPQAFTHIGLISAALTLAEQERGADHPAVKTGEDVRTATGVKA